MLSMCRNKKILAAAMTLCLMGSSALAVSANLISEDKIVSNTVNYEMYTAEKGTMERKVSLSGEVFLPYTYNLCPEADGLKFESYAVKRGDMVRAGDVLAVFSSNVDEVSLAEEKLRLERTQDAFDAETESRQAEIDGMQLSLLSLRDSNEIRMSELKIRRAELSLEQYIYQTEAEIQDIQKRIDDLEAQRADSCMLAPVDGIIHKIITRKAGDRIYRNETMIVMYSTAGALVQVKNSQGALRYGMEVEITVGNLKRQSIPGTVVSADQMLPASQKTGYAYIKPAYYDPMSTSVENPKVSASTIFLDNVLLVPRSALGLESGRYYVTQLSDGVPGKRYVNAFVGNDYGWVIQGIEPGDEVIAD